MILASRAGMDPARSQCAIIVSVTELETLAYRPKIGRRAYHIRVHHLPRLKTSLRKLGFLVRSTATHDHLRALNPTPTAILLVFHHEFASSATRTVELPSILANPFWKYLGCKSEEEVRQIFRDADMKELIGKYVVADQLEMVTPCFTLDEALKRKTRL